MSNDIEKDLEVEEGPETIEKEKMLTQKKGTFAKKIDIRNDKANFQEDYLKLRTKW